MKNKETKKTKMQGIDKELYKEVSKCETAELFPSHKFPSKYSHAIVDVDGNVLSLCSDNYNLRSNQSLFLPLEQIMRDEKIPFDRKVNIRDGSKFYVDYIIANRVKGNSVNDILPKFSVWNSYDGTVRTVMKFGFYRLVCSNGLTVPHGKSINVDKKHYKASMVEDGIDISAITNPGTILEPFKMFMKEAKEHIGVYENLNKLKADIEQIKGICEKLKFSKGIMDMAVERFNKETSSNRSLTYVNENGEMVTHEGNNPTLYIAYNAINYAIYNNNVRELPEFKAKRDEAALSEIMLLS